MLNTIEQAFEGETAGTWRIGQVLIQKTRDGKFALSHRDDEDSDPGQVFWNPEDAAEIAKYDEEGKYRPLKTAPNLRRGWRLEIVDLTGLVSRAGLFLSRQTRAVQRMENKSPRHHDAARHFKSTIGHVSRRSENFG